MQLHCETVPPGASHRIFLEILNNEEIVSCSVGVLVFLILSDVYLNVVFNALHCSFSLNTLHHHYQCCSGNFVLGGHGCEVLLKL